MTEMQGDLHCLNLGICGVGRVEVGSRMNRYKANAKCGVELIGGEFRDNDMAGLSYGTDGVCGGDFTVRVRCNDTEYSVSR